MKNSHNKNDMYSKDDIINWILTKATEENDEITPKKLQKILFYVYAWGLVFFNETSEDIRSSVFDGEFQAWVHGPVDPEVYHLYKSYGYSPIKKEVTDEKTTNFNDDVQNVLNQVWNIYGSYSGDELESITHQEDPWKIARGKTSPLEISQTRINDKNIFNYYEKMMS